MLQTFWSARKDILHSDFGWLSPQHHLMAWALSCLRLREHYDDIELYTDRRGEAIFIDALGLPYTKVHSCYECLSIDERLWATPKLITYSSQTTPFIHVDGDVFVWERLGAKVEGAGLVAQNREQGTAYYKSMMDGIIGNIAYLPSLLQRELERPSISSYNAGIIGGSDLSFIHMYAQQALDLIYINYADVPNENDHSLNISINFNILAEQILFCALAVEKDKEVTCLLDHTFNDNGYTAVDFCDFSSIGHKLHYLHVIGGHKKNKSICEMLERTLLEYYPDHFFKIISLFEEKHVLFKRKIVPLMESEWGISVPEEIKPAPVVNVATNEYEQWRTVAVEDWDQAPVLDLYLLERNANRYFTFFHLPKVRQECIKVKANPFIKIMEESFGWDKDGVDLFKTDLWVEPTVGAKGLACIPHLFLDGYKDVVIDELSYNILLLSEQPITFSALIQELNACIDGEEDLQDKEAFYHLLLAKLRYLFHHRCLFI